jgi:hypothetical protein
MVDIFLLHVGLRFGNKDLCEYVVVFPPLGGVLNIRRQVKNNAGKLVRLFRKIC